jgi:replicative DNA helicase
MTRAARRAKPAKPALSVVPDEPRPARKPLPHNLDLEASILGGIILRNELLAELEDLETADFYHHPHRVVFDAIRNLQHAGRPIDVTTLEYEIERDGKLEAIGGIAFLGELCLRVPTADNVLAYRDIVARDSRNRKAILALSSALERAYTWAHDPSELIAETAGELERLDASARRSSSEAVPFARAPELEAALEESAQLPWVELSLEDGAPPIARGPTGAYAVIVGWEGSGKSSLVMQLGIVAARSGHAFVYMVTELDRAEAAARIVGLQTGHSWEDAHRGRVPREDRRAALAMPSFVVLTGDDATIENLRRTVEVLRAEAPDRPIVVAIDYLQDVDIEGSDERAKVRAVSRLIRREAKRLRVFAVGVSQTSRDGRKELRSGEALGADTATKGAESSQIERDAYLLLALGNPQKQPDGSIAMDLSVGKGRMRAGDQVYPIIYDGRTGRTRLVGEARSAGDVRKERESERGRKKRETLKRAIVDLVSKSSRALSKAEITRATDGNNAAIADAIKELVRDGLIVHDLRASKGGHAPIWTPAQIAADAAKQAAEIAQAPAQQALPT